MSAKYKSPSFLLPNEINTNTNPLNTDGNPATGTGINSLYSMNFDAGQRDYIDLGTGIGDKLGSSYNGVISISAWFYFDGLWDNSINDAIIQIGGNLSNNYGKIAIYGASQSLYVDTSNNSGSRVSAKIANVNLSPYNFSRRWVHLVVVWDLQNSSNSKIYIDGSVVDLTQAGNLNNWTTDTIDFTNKESWIGVYFNPALNTTWNGQIDEVAIFNRALESTEIAALYGGTSPNIYPSNLMATDLNPLAYYPLGEQAQNTGYVGSGDPGNPTTLSNVWQFPNGVLQDYVMDFDSTSPGDYINIGIPNFLSATSTFTSSLWFNTDDVNSQTTLWMVGSSASQLWGLSKFEDDLIIYGGSSTKYYRKDTLFNINTWYNLIVVYDGSQSNANRYKAYLNGVLLTSPTIYGTIDTTTPTFTTDFNIGRIDYAAASYFNGKISNVAVWNTAITDANQIANIYNNGSPQTTYTVTPQNWWKLNADSVYTPSAPNYTKALSFNGGIGGALINLGNNSTLNITSSLSVSAWFKTLNNTGSIVIATKDDGGSNRAWQLYMISTGSIRFGINGVAALATSSGVYDDGNWHHVVALYEPSNYVKLYIDGVADGEDTSSVPASINDLPSQDVVIGAYSVYDSGTRWNGEISNVAIFDSGLTSSQVSTLFNFGTPETNISFSPQAWWKLDDQTAITDYSGNGNTGTNNGATDATTSVAVVPSWKIPSALPIPTINTTSAINIGTAGTNPGPIGLNPYFNFDLSSVTTTSIWIKPPASGSAQQGTILGNNGATGGATVDSTILLAWRSSSVAPYNKVIETYDYGWLGNKVVSNSFSNDFWYGNWHHILMIRNNQNVSFFVDGVAAGGGTFASSQSTTPVNVNAIGGALSNWYFQNGEISNLAIWNSDQSVNKDNIYNNGQPQSSYTVTPDHLFTLDNLTTGINDVYSSSAGTATSGVTKVDTNVYVGNIPVNGVSTTLPSTALQQSDLQFDSPYSNYSLSFDGGGTSYIDIQSSTELDNVPSNPYSFSFWFKSSAAGDVISEKRAGNQFINAQYTIHLESGYIKWYGGADGVTSGTQTSTTLNDNQWHHIVCVAESTTVNKIYVDGQLDVTSSANRINSLVVTGTFNIGANYVGSYRYEGKLDETSIFNYALSSAQVLEIYNNGRPKDLTTFSGTAPISWWRLGENAYFNNNSFVVPNSISGAPNGTGAGTITTMISADAPGTYANGIGTNLAILDRVGDAPLSTSNSQSYNMIPDDKVPYVPKYVGKQIANNFSMTFDGTNYFTASSKFDFIQQTGIFSISTWIKMSDNTSATNQVIAGTNYTGSNVGWQLWIDNRSSQSPAVNKTLKFHLWNSSTNLLAIDQVITDNNWNLITITGDGTTIRAYKNGSLLSTTQSISGSTSSIAFSDLRIGANTASSPSVFFNGQIDEVAIFDKALTADQVKFDLYKPTAEGTNKTADIANNPNLPTPVAWYRMGD